VFGLLRGNAFMFGLCGSLALTFGRDALRFGLFDRQAFDLGLQFGLALRLGLAVDAARVRATAQHLPADQQAKARSEKQPKKVFTHEWNVRRKQCNEHRCDSAATPHSRRPHAHKFLDLCADFSSDCIAVRRCHDVHGLCWRMNLRCNSLPLLPRLATG
jgi:hypothetical protein